MRWSLWYLQHASYFAGSVDQMMTFVGHRDIRTAMRHYRDPDATSTQAIAARLAAAGEQATPDARVVPLPVNVSS
ncbi:MAG: hypothetical protein NTW87_06820 [Planctomycetota bacterium]|nr:hypothetical protein [Planctomycetota bacterium]